MKIILSKNDFEKMIEVLLGDQYTDLINTKYSIYYKEKIYDMEEIHNVNEMVTFIIEAR